MLGCGGQSRRDMLKMHKNLQGVARSNAQGPGRGCKWVSRGCGALGIPALIVGSPLPFTPLGLPLCRPSWTLNCQNSDTLARWLDGCKL